MHRIDSAGATGTNQWTEGDPSTGVPATEFSADFMNAIQNELENVIVTEAGIPLNKASNAQLQAACVAICAKYAGSFVCSAVSGASKTYALADRGTTQKRTHSSAMSDTLSGTSPGVMANGWNLRIVNNSAQTYGISPGSGALINGSSSSVSIAANTCKEFFSDGSNYFTV